MLYRIKNKLINIDINKFKSDVSYNEYIISLYSFNINKDFNCNNTYNKLTYIMNN
jgi:hypothetical protein